MIERGAIAALGLSILAHVALLGADPFEVRTVGPAVAAEHAPPMVFVDISAFRPPAPEPQAVPAVAEAPEPVAPVPVVKPKPVPKPRPAPLAALSAELLPVVEETVVDALAAEAVPDDEVQTHADPLPETLAAAGAGFLPQPQGEVFSIDGWPTHGAIVFRVLLGDKGLQVGEAAEIDRTTAERAELRAIGDAKRAERNAFKEAEKAWRLTPDGIAHTARENDLEGLEIVSDIDKRDDGTIYATFSLVGQQQDNHVSEIRPKYRYARVEVGRRVDRDWETGAIMCRKPTISCSSLNDSLGYVRNMQRLISAAIEYAETL